MDRTRTLDRDELEKFVASLSEQEVAIPDELVRHYLSRAGFMTSDVRLERLVALATQKFLADIANDAIAHSRLRATVVQSASKKKLAHDAKIVLTVDDLERALREYGVPFRKPPYFANTVNAGAPDPPPVAAAAPVAAATVTAAAKPKVAGGATTVKGGVGVGKVKSNK